MLGESVWGMKSKQEHELILDKLDEEMVLDVEDTTQDGFRNVYNLRKYNQLKAKTEFIKQNGKRFPSNQNLNILKFN